jgi:Ser/Thr protein kinase RdoA (MazF antagonist)
LPHESSLDPHAILAQLGVHTVQAIAPVAGGTDTALWRVEHDQNVSALRVFRPGSAPVYLRELAALELAAGHGLPVPAVRAHGRWSDRPALLLAWCAGLPLADSLRRHPGQLVRLGRAFGQMHARLHRVAAPALHDIAPGDWIDWHGAADGELADRLRRDAGQARQLLHLDYHPLNVLSAAGAITGVLDWANARLGDSRADVARTYTILVVEPHRPGREPRWYRVARHMLAQCYLAGYQAAAGRLRQMPIFFAWAGAAMWADLAPRVGDPHSWWGPEQLATVERWSVRWRQRAGLAPA